MAYLYAFKVELHTLFVKPHCPCLSFTLDGRGLFANHHLSICSKQSVVHRHLRKPKHLQQFNPQRKKNNNKTALKKTLVFIFVRNNKQPQTSPQAILTKSILKPSFFSLKHFAGNKINELRKSRSLSTSLLQDSSDSSIFSDKRS